MEMNQAGGLTLSAIKTYYKVTIIQTLWYRWKITQIDQWNKINSSKIEFPEYNHLWQKSKGHKTEQRLSLQVVEPVDIAYKKNQIQTLHMSQKLTLNGSWASTQSTIL